MYYNTRRYKLRRTQRTQPGGGRRLPRWPRLTLPPTAPAAKSSILVPSRSARSSRLASFAADMTLPLAAVAFDRRDPRAAAWTRARAPPPPPPPPPPRPFHAAGRGRGRRCRHSTAAAAAAPPQHPPQAAACGAPRTRRATTRAAAAALAAAAAARIAAALTVAVTPPPSSRATATSASATCAAAATFLVVEAGDARERRGAGNLHGGRRGDEGERERQQRFGGGALGVRVEEHAAHDGGGADRVKPVQRVRECGGAQQDREELAARRDDRRRLRPKAAHALEVREDAAEARGRLHEEERQRGAVRAEEGERAAELAGGDRRCEREQRRDPIRVEHDLALWALEILQQPLLHVGQRRVDATAPTSSAQPASEERSAAAPPREPPRRKTTRPAPRSPSTQTTPPSTSAERDGSINMTTTILDDLKRTLVAIDTNESAAVDSPFADAIGNESARYQPRCAASARRPARRAPAPPRASAARTRAMRPRSAA